MYIAMQQNYIGKKKNSNDEHFHNIWKKHEACQINALLSSAVDKNMKYLSWKLLHETWKLA